MPKAKTKWAGIEYPRQHFALVFDDAEGNPCAWVYLNREERAWSAKNWREIGVRPVAVNILAKPFHDIPTSYWKRISR